MTEAEWFVCKHPKQMFGVLFTRGEKKGETKRWSGVSEDERFRMFGIACCRRVASVLVFGDTYALDCLEIYAREGLREALLKARRFQRPAREEASKLASSTDWLDRVASRKCTARLLATSAVWSCTKGKPTQAAMAYLEAAKATASINLITNTKANTIPYDAYPPPLPAEMAAQCDLLRDIFGNPFRPVAFDPRWRTEHTVGIASKMYDERGFAAMPILADALEEAGCDSEAILTHCREPGVHVRGCWVVDLVLGKS